MSIPEQHKSWFETVCKEAGMPAEAAATAYEEGGLVIGDVPFIFVTGVAGSETSLLVQALIDVLPQQCAHAIMCRMLEAQMLTAGAGPVFGLEPVSNAALLIQSIEPANIEPAEMVIMMRLNAKAAKSWREVLYAAGPVQANAKQKNLINKLPGAKGE